MTNCRFLRYVIKESLTRLNRRRLFMYCATKNTSLYDECSPYCDNYIKPRGSVKVIFKGLCTFYTKDKIRLYLKNGEEVILEDFKLLFDHFEYQNGNKIYYDTIKKIEKEQK